jgi:ATP-dependent Lon protease
MTENGRCVISAPLEARRRLKEQQKRCFQSEFHNTHLGCILGPDGVEQFVWTSEFHADKAIDSGVPMASI